MRFFQNLSTLLLGAALAGSVVAVPKPTEVDNPLVRRFQNLEEDIKADHETWVKYEAAAHATSKRSLSKRLDGTEVAMGESKSWNFPIGLWTQGLVPCIGLAVVDNKKGNPGTLVRVLGHFTASEFNKENQWQVFKGLVDAEDMENKRGFMSVPDLNEGLVEGFDDKMKKVGKEIEDELKDRMDSIVEGNAHVTRRHMIPATTMNIDKDNNVFVNGQQVS
ncbi:hypothetical protein BCR34DRAFT_599777 [Clohesyomyces aquaticus]|uniref:Uncharacterized protein n=1 Tax=Clohesyomyces aquaticus TaxID=1231657 RepID=A0A1Y1ZUZ5_9PLEO|nr:hypothetical protein BCR34DRAFT_599777 [Clohesyomyces aquaticus]